jgi:predicted lysophospholipase L1 biosynthesis ABC-type transport system permease subunit
VKLVLGGRNPIGRRIRYTHFEQWSDRRSPDGKPGPWYEIVGVVSDLGMSTNDDPKVAGLYHPMAVGAAAPVHLAIHVRGDPMGLAPRLRTLALEVDPTLRVDRVMRMDRISEAELQFLDFWFRLTVLVSCIAVILSLAGIYSVMSFTVARRTREIGVRIALGASARRVVAAIFARPIKQVAIGIGAGWMLVALFLLGAWGGRVPATWVALLVAYAAFMMMVCMLACIVPTLRALRVQPTEALRADG